MMSSEQESFKKDKENTTSGTCETIMKSKFRARQVPEVQEKECSIKKIEEIKAEIIPNW